jgi:VanZ family protein
MFLSPVLGRICKYWLPVVLWMSVIFSASTGLGAPANTSKYFRPVIYWLFPNMPEETYEEVHFCFRKTAHFVEYAILGILVWRAVHSEPALASFSLRRKGCLVVLACMLYASTDEFHQEFVPTREPAIHDVMLDTFGASCGLLAALGVRRLHAGGGNLPLREKNQPT